MFATTTSRVKQTNAIVLAIILVSFVSAAFAISLNECPPETEEWKDSDSLSLAWNIIRGGSLEQIEQMLASNPCLIHARANDGRGPLFWAYEFGKSDVIQYLLSQGANPNNKDKDGKYPRDMKPSTPEPEVFNKQYQPSQEELQDAAQKSKRAAEDKERQARHEQKQKEEEEEALRLAKQRLEEMKSASEKDEL